MSADVGCRRIRKRGSGAAPWRWEVGTEDVPYEGHVRTWKAAMARSELVAQNVMKRAGRRGATCEACVTVLDSDGSCWWCDDPDPIAEAIALRAALAACEDSRTLGGTPRPCTPGWANAGSSSPDSADDSDAPALRRGPERNEP